MGNGAATAAAAAQERWAEGRSCAESERSDRVVSIIPKSVEDEQSAREAKVVESQRRRSFAGKRRLTLRLGRPLVLPDKLSNTRPSRKKRPRRPLLENVDADVRVKYSIHRKELGCGHYGIVRRCQDRITKRLLACKTIKKGQSEQHRNNLRDEVNILRSTSHPNIIELVDVFEEEKYIHLVTELCDGGEMFDHILAKTRSGAGKYSEADAAQLVWKILAAVRYLHDQNICHRDLKPENFLFKTTSDTKQSGRVGHNLELKLIDFGLSCKCDPETKMTARVGTPYYIAPEVLARSYGKECDLWSVGVIMYILLCGFPPFCGDSDEDIFAAIKNGRVRFPSPEWDDVSREAKDLIANLLDQDPVSRLTAEQAMHHYWFKHVESCEDILNVGEQMRNFAGMNRLKKVALNVIAHHLNEHEIAHLRDVFTQLDVNGDGRITVDELRRVMNEHSNQEVDSDLQNLLAGVDIAGDNNLDYREFIAATMDYNIFIREENLQRAFEFFDTRKRGSISLADLVDVFGSMVQAREILGTVDLDGDGKISYEEFKAMMRREAKMDYRRSFSSSDESRSSSPPHSPKKWCADEKCLEGSSNAGFERGFQAEKPEVDASTEGLIGESCSVDPRDSASSETTAETSALCETRKSSSDLSPFEVAQVLQALSKV